MNNIRYYIVGSIVWCLPISVCAMEENTKIESPILYCMNSTKKHYVFLQSSLLSEELNKFRAIGKMNPYALVYLKQILSPADSDIQVHAWAMSGKEARYNRVLQDCNVMDKYKTINPTARAIANVAIKVGDDAVLVARPAWFDKRRVGQHDAPDASKNARADIGGVDYSRGDVVCITDNVLQECT